jgi:hypothetical protein
LNVSHDGNGIENPPRGRKMIPIVRSRKVGKRGRR